MAWGLFKDGMRSLTIRRGAEQEELPRLLEAINRARYLPADAGDDLLTLLWEQEFQFIQYQFVEFFGEGGGSLPEQTGTYASAATTTRRAGARRRSRRRRRRGRRAWSTWRTSTPRSTSSTSRRSTRSRGRSKQEYGRDVRTLVAQRAVRPVRAGGRAGHPRRDHRHPGAPLPQPAQRARFPDRGERAPREQAAGHSGAGAPARAPGAARRLRGQAERAGDREPAAPVARRGAGARGGGGGGRGAARAPRLGPGAGAELDPEPVLAGAAVPCWRMWPTGWRPPTPTRCCASCARRSRRRSRPW